MSALELYLRRLDEAKGMQHLVKLDALRDYIRNTSDEELIRHINRITEQRWLRILVEAGLRPALLKAVLARHDELIRRRTGVR